jgi:soluble lytic murein transglycosylase-like protein
MIEKTYMPWLTPVSLKGMAVSPAGNAPGSPFLELLQQELSHSRVIDQILLNYLLKTIKAALLRHGQEESFSPFPSLPPALPPAAVGEVSPNPVSEKISPAPPAPPPSETPRIQKIDEAIRSAADQYDLEPALIKAVIAVESNGNPKAVSPAGAQGLMQLMPKTAADLGVTDPFDPAQNIKAGSRYLRQLLDRYQGNLQLALAAYNWGMGHLERNPHGLPKETQNYIVRVEKQYQSYLNASSTA